MSVSRSARGLVRSLARRLGVTLHRWPASRFNAMDDALELLDRAGFRPDVVIDVGANVGLWTATARARFPDATYHLVEPQTGCLAILTALAERTGRLHVYGTAATRPGVPTVLMAGGGAGKDSSGNFVFRSASSTAELIPYPSTTLDALFARVEGSRLLLKLDVEGHELEVLEGASAVLDRAEVVITEFWMFRRHHEPMPILPDLIAALDAHGFVLFDFAALHGRRRDKRLVSGDAVFVRRTSELFADIA